MAMMEGLCGCARQQREFSEYQLYEVSRPVTVGTTIKQVEFVQLRRHGHLHFVYS
jgi:hypothetical protein